MKVIAEQRGLANALCWKVLGLIHSSLVCLGPDRHYAKASAHCFFSDNPQLFAHNSTDFLTCLQSFRGSKILAVARETERKPIASALVTYHEQHSATDVSHLNLGLGQAGESCLWLRLTLTVGLGEA